jgi:hypothetical protein
LSFFDEVDEPPRTEPRSTSRSSSRSAPRRRRPSGTGGRRPPGDQQSIQVRRAVAIGGLLVVILLIALGVHGCEQSATDSALQDYTNQVSSVIAQSTTTGHDLFNVLSTAAGSSSTTTVNENVNQALAQAKSQLDTTKALSVPSQVAAANSKLVLAMQMRVDGITNISNEIQPALGTSNAAGAVRAIAGETATFYASDVLYKSYVVPEVYGALHAAGTKFSGLNPGQFVPSVNWLLPTYIATALHVTLPSSSSSGSGASKTCPTSACGHQLLSVSVAGITLQTGSTNAITAKPPPTFTLNFKNSGTSNESDVGCQVTVTGTSVSGKAVVPETTAGQNATCQVKLNAAPPTGTYSVVARIDKVAGEKILSNNVMTFPVTFQ